MTGCQMGCRADRYCTSTGTAVFEDLDVSRAWNMQCNELGSGSASWEMSCGFLCAVGLRCMTLSAWARSMMIETARTV
jgi:hypothetical protein